VRGAEVRQAWQIPSSNLHGEEINKPMTPEAILAFATVITAIGSMLVAIWTLATSARRSEIDRLEKCVNDQEQKIQAQDKKIDGLQEENERLHVENTKLRAELIWVRTFLAKQGITIPPMPNGEVKQMPLSSVWCDLTQADEVCV
jgi:septal ring factor EnvC (AmiA/AmiB activator)